jgi:UDP-glucose 4-epimerase
MTEPSRRRRFLVTGGAGYIGSHIVRDLTAAGHRVTVYDSLYSGHRWAVLGAELVEADLGERARLESVLEKSSFDAVVHCAGHIWVGESVANPGKYYFNNAANAFRLFDLCAQYGIGHVVFSSTAAVYGQPAVELIDEDQPLLPINPYGASKLMAERALQDIAAASGMTYAILRYFNVAGADAEARLGEATPNNSHLIKVALETAMGRRTEMRLNGVDYPTPDGTCIRDYVHVDDLAAAHVMALDHLIGGGSSLIANCGYGRGYSVRQVLDMVERITGRTLPVRHGDRRPGDPAVLVADNRRIRDILGWQPTRADLETIVASAWRFEQTLDDRQRGGLAKSA